MLIPGRPTERSLDRLLTAAKAAAPNYAEVGATVEGPLPPGYRHGRYEVVVGRGDEAFDRAAEALRTWAVHARLGMRVVSDGPDLAVGTTVLVVVPLGPVTAVARCRVIAVFDEPDRFGFAYGSLPGHPERGEEAFAVVRRPDGTVVCTITVFFRHADPLVRLAGPVADFMQRRFTRRYLQAMAAIAAGEE